MSRGGGGGGRHTSRGVLIPLLALEAVKQYYWLPWKPPVTAGVIAANTLIYMRPQVVRRVIPPLEQVWFNPHLILKYRDWKRLLLSPFYHLGEPHLFYNMLSLLWKGVRLETRMGSLDFSSMLATLLLLSQGITLLLSKSLLFFFHYPTPFYNEYSVGFSGVLFAMKVVLNSLSSHNDYAFVHGMVVPTKYAAWAELILVQMFVPGVSFWGHLGGLLAGILYVKLRQYFSGGSDPLASLLKGLLTWPLRFLQQLQPRRGRISGRGRVGSGTDEGVWRCGACTFDNSGWLSECEMCGTRRAAASASDSASSSSSSSSASSRELGVDELTLEEIRLRRVQRFGRR